MSFCQIATTYFAGFTKKYKAVPVLIALVFLLLILSATGNKTFIQTLSIQRKIPQMNDAKKDGKREEDKVWKKMKFK